MNFLIFLFAVITFVLIAADPRREDFEVRNSKKVNVKAVSAQNKDSEGMKLNKDQEDRSESS